jgi:hypothetical protein
LVGVAEELGGDAAEQLKRFADMAASNEAYQELLARALTIAQDAVMRDKRRALSKALGNALDDSGTKVDNEIAFVRMLADLDPVHLRVLKIMSAVRSTWIGSHGRWTRLMTPKRSGGGTSGASPRLTAALKGQYRERCRCCNGMA